MSVSINFHDLAAARAERLDSGNVWVELTDDRGNKVHLFLAGRGQASLLTSAGLTARDLLPGGEGEDGERAIHPAACHPVCCGAADQSFRCEEAHGHLGDHRAYIDGQQVHRWPATPPSPEKACGADWGSATTSQRCVLPEGHDGNHIDSAGHAWALPCGPGECACGAHVGADGAVTYGRGPAPEGAL